MEAGWSTLNNDRLRKAVFLDRDGVINKCAAPHCYISKWEDFEFLTGAVKGIETFNKAGYLTLIISNQRGIARGLCTEAEVDALHARMCEQMEKEGAHIDGIYICPHNEGECRCRKPDIGLFLNAERDFGIDKKKSFCIGDFQSDIEAGIRYGVSTVLIGNGRKDYGQDYTFSSLEEAALYLAGLEETEPKEAPG